jgi:hypothetical protein
MFVTGKDMAAHNGKFLFGKVLPYLCDTSHIMLMPAPPQAMVCDKLEVACPLGCGELMLFKDKEHHFGAGGCTRTKVCCEDCGMRLRRMDIPSHLASACIKREVACSLGCKERSVQPVLLAALV